MQHCSTGRTTLCLALVVFLRDTRGNHLHALGNHLPAGVMHQQVNVIRGHHIVEHRQTNARLGLEAPPQVTAPIARTFQEQCLVVAAVSEVPDLTR